MASRSAEVFEQDASAHVYEIPTHVHRIKSKDSLAAFPRQFTASSEKRSKTHDSRDSEGSLHFPLLPNPQCSTLRKSSLHMPLAEVFDNSPALTSLCIFLGSYRELNRLQCVSRECKAMLDETRHSTNRDYLCKQIAWHVFRVPFKIESQRSLQRWENYQVYWLPIHGTGTPYWLVRGADGNPVGENLSRNVFAFGGSSVTGDNYSKTLYQLSWSAPDSVEQKEVESIVDSSFPSRAACGFVQTNNGVCYVFGGRSGTHYLDDLWSFKVTDPITWVPFMPQDACPAPRWAHAMVSIGETGFLLYGGSAPGRLFGDLWYFNGTVWSILEQSESRPHDRAGHAVAIISTGSRDWLYVFGGNTAGPVVETYGDLWRLPLCCDDKTCVTTGPWESVDVQGPSLTPRIGHSLTLCGKRLVIFGGRNLSATSDQQFATVMDIIDLDFHTGGAQNTVVPVPPNVRRTGHFVLSHPQGLVFAAGLSSTRNISTTVLCAMV